MIMIEVARHPSNTRQRSTAYTLALTMEHIENHFTEPLPMNEVTKKARCSRAHMFLVFRRETGMIPNDWLQGRRVKAVAGLLRANDRKLEDIASATGFQPPSIAAKSPQNTLGRRPARIGESYCGGSGSPASARTHPVRQLLSAEFRFKDGLSSMRRN